MNRSRSDRSSDLITYGNAAAAGLTDSLLRAHRDGRLVRVARGGYVPAKNLLQGSASEQAAALHERRVLAAARRMTVPIFTGYSAIALCGLPIIGSWPEEVYVLSGTAHGKRRTGVVSLARRHEVAVVEVGGLMMTPIEYSLIQRARTAPLRAALAAANAACLRPRFAGGAGRTTPGDRPPLTTPARLRAEHERLLPYRCSRRVAAVLNRVRDNAESTLETLSDVLIDELGFATALHQVRIALPSGGDAFLDFYWEQPGIAGEADGESKYRSAATGGDAAQRVIDEKYREDEIRSQVSALVRWNWQDCWQRSRLEAKLLRAGVPRVHR
ncbi:hypothetical protein [Ruania halotolerans]|uniref:hypothetical protein n=1 Tax=Ruania halotolerans TaxID=2897773 RepID=UPI001E4B0117|nr:hypothetical protein [Ruania halotolerans]UFU05926.1 hypothetical protein LQF10_16075 [Ruania halotolerans]